MGVRDERLLNVLTDLAKGHKALPYLGTMTRGSVGPYVGAGGLGLNSLISIVLAARHSPCTCLKGNEESSQRVHCDQAAICYLLTLLAPTTRKKLEIRHGLPSRVLLRECLLYKLPIVAV